MMHSKVVYLSVIIVTFFGTAENTFTFGRGLALFEDKPIKGLGEDKSASENGGYEVNPGYLTAFNTEDYHNEDGDAHHDYAAGGSIIRGHDTFDNDINEINDHGNYQGAHHNRDGNAQHYGGYKDGDNGNGYSLEYKHGYYRKHNYQHRHRHHDGKEPGGREDDDHGHYGVYVEHDHDSITHVTKNDDYPWDRYDDRFEFHH